MIARATVSPPTPESKMPIGASAFMGCGVTASEFTRASPHSPLTALPLSLGLPVSSLGLPGDELASDRPLRTHDDRRGNPFRYRRTPQRVRGVRPQPSRGAPLR